MHRRSDGNLPVPRCWNCALDLVKARLVLISEAAQLCEVSPPTVRKWMEQSDVEWLRLPSGNALILADTLPTGNSPLRDLRGLRGESRGSNHEGREGRRCFVCGRPADRERVLLDQTQAKRLCRVQKRTLKRWLADGLVEHVQGPSGRLYYLDSLFEEPRRFRDLDVRH